MEIQAAAQALSSASRPQFFQQSRIPCRHIPGVVEGVLAENAESERYNQPDSDDPENGYSESADSVLPSEVLEKLPPEQRTRVQQFFAAGMQLTGPANPIANKVTASHISDIISLSRQELDHDYNDRKHSRLVIAVSLGSFLVIIVIFGGFLAFLRQNDLLLEMLKVGAALLVQNQATSFARVSG